jgi:hypothetical protein
MAQPIVPAPQSPPPGFAVGPGMTTSNVVGSTYSAMTPTAEAYYYKELDRKREEQEARNAEIRAQQAGQQQARQDEENQARVQAAFNQTYGPQLQRAYQESAVQSAPVNTAAGKARDWAIGHGQTTGGTIGQPNTSYLAAAARELPKPEMSQPEIQNTLNYMWRQQTDPYQRTVNNMNMMRMFYPTGGTPRGGGGSSTGRSGVGKTTSVDKPLPTVEEWKEKYPK